jgi:hypothetical protein
MINNKGYTRNNEFTGLAPLVLFLSSYMPLFVLIIARQCITNAAYMHWAGFSIDAVFYLIKYFGVSLLCTFFVTFGLYGTYMTFKRLHKKVENGNVVTVSEVTSINDEPLAYMATYIIPILFQDYSNLTDCLTLFVLFYVVYRLYIRSRLILVNPILNLKYSIYSFKYKDGDIERQGILISKNKSIYEDENVKIYSVGYQLFYGYIRQSS